MQDKTHIKLQYKHHWIDHPLQIVTKINDRIINLDVSGQENVTVDKKITTSYNEEQIIKLEISNKNESNTQIDDKGTILNDTLIHIESLRLNDIEMMPLINHNDFQFFYIDNQKDQVLHKLVEIGHNGTWEFHFKTPIYDWMLECLF